MKKYMVYYEKKTESEIIESYSFFDNLEEAVTFKDVLMNDSNVIEVILYECQ